MSGHVARVMMRGRRPPLRLRVAGLLIPPASLVAVSYFALWGCEDLGCTTGADCDTGYCWRKSGSDEGGVCCDTPCDGACEGCEGGTCAPILTDAPLDACGGYCDGVDGTETFPDSTVQCRPASCSVTGATMEHTATLEAFCDGRGHCPPEQTQACAPLLCGETTCEGGCTTEAECGPSEVCVAGVCVAKQPLGVGCSIDAQCESGFCVLTRYQNFVCCDAACAGECERCDPNGTCTPVQLPTSNECRPCDGENGATRSFAPAGTPCGETCEGGISCICQTGERDVCDGWGHCWAPPEIRCENVEVEGGGCSCSVVGGEQR